jgi:hypothetical protein
MAETPLSHNVSLNPDPQVNQVSGDGITPSQEQQPLPDRLPQSLLEWLARTLAPAASAGVNRRYLALNQDKTIATHSKC